MIKSIDNLLEDFFNEENNIIAKAKNMINLVEAISTKKDKKTYIDNFFTMLDLEHYKMVEEKGFGYIGAEAISNYFYCFVNICRYYSEDICLEQIKRIGNIIIESFYNDENAFSSITQEKVEEIIDYLDKKYEFFEKCGYFIYSILDYKNKFSDGLLGINRIPKFNEIEYNIFLFRTKEEEASTYIFFHEIGNYIHSNITKGEFYFPDFLDKEFKKANIDLSAYDVDERNNIIATLFAVGLMYDSPYCKNDIIFNQMPTKQKEMFRNIVDEILVLRNKVNTTVN